MHRAVQYDSRLMRRTRALIAAASILAGALALRLILPFGFPNYDTLYSLVWGQQLERGQSPTYNVVLAPTPHPLAEIVGTVLAPFGAAATLSVVLVIAYLALAALPYLVYRLGSEWFSWPVGLAAAAFLISRYEVLSYGVRAYVDIPYTALILCALLVETRRRKAGWPVIVLLDIAGLLRPEAWLFAGVYWVYLAWDAGWRRRVSLAALVAVAPLVWVLSDLAITGDLLWSLTHTQHTASQLKRPTGIVKFPYTAARRLGEVMAPDGLVAAAIGGVLALWLLRERIVLGLCAGLVALVAFAVIASSGLPIDDRYTFVLVALLSVCAGAGLFGWRSLPAGHPRRRLWQAGSVVCVVAIVAFVPWNATRLNETFNSTNPKKQSLSAQYRIEQDLIALTRDHAISASCAPIGVPYHTPVPLLALELHLSPARVEPAEIAHGTFVAAASVAVRLTYLLDQNDPSTAYNLPSGFKLSATNRSWRVYRRCA
jgi:hypothetical protein